MGLVRVEIDGDAVQALLKSQAVQDDLVRRGEAIAAAAASSAGIDEDEFAAIRGRVGKTRTRVFVATQSRSAREAEAKDRVLSKSLDAGR